MTFINLTCRKGEDFFVTSSEVVQDLYPEADEALVMDYLMARIKEYIKLGYSVEVKQ